MKKNFLTVMIYAAIFSVLLVSAAGAFADIAYPEEHKQDAQVPRRAGSPLREASVSRAAAEMTPTPTTLSGDDRLIGRWRAVLPHYGFIYLYLYQNADFIQEVRFNISSSGSTFVSSWEEVYKGSYDISGGNLSLTFMSAEHHDYGHGWEPIALPANRSLAYTYGELESRTFINFTNGGLPPFDAPVHIREDQTASDTPTLTTFYLMDDGSTVFGK